MFPLPFSISPVLLSILVFYPWALALGVWQVGKLTSRGNGPSSAQVCEVDRVGGGGVRLVSGLDPIASPFVTLAVPATLAGFELILDSAERYYLSTVHLAIGSPAIAHLSPRAPPSFS